jgi:hypothetical protein
VDDTEGCEAGHSERIIGRYSYKRQNAYTDSGYYYACRGALARTYLKITDCCRSAINAE